jgi:hypothetical protein
MLNTRDMKVQRSRLHVTDFQGNGSDVKRRFVGSAYKKN